MVVAALIVAGILLLVLFGLFVVLLGNARQAEMMTMVPPQDQAAAAPPPPPPAENANDVPPEVTALVEQGRMVEAVKRVRQLKGLSTAEAKAWVDGLRAGHATVRSRTPALVMRLDESDIQREIREGRMINAIKLYREMTGVGLKEARDAVQALRDRMRMS